MTASLSRQALIEKTLAEHKPRDLHGGEWFACSCGDEAPQTVAPEEWHDWHRAHVAAVLAALDAPEGGDEARLSEGEREALRETIENYGCCHPADGPVESDGRCSKCLFVALPVVVEVERILADRLAAPRDQAGDTPGDPECNEYGHLMSLHLTTGCSLTKPGASMTAQGQTGPTTQDEVEVDDGPGCETCGKTTCPDAQLPAFSEPRECIYAPIYHAIKDSKDCDYGCARDFTNQAICLEVVPAVEQIVAAEVERQITAARAQAWDEGWTSGMADAATLYRGDNPNATVTTNPYRADTEGTDPA